MAMWAQIQVECDICGARCPAEVKWDGVVRLPRKPNNLGGWTVPQSGAAMDSARPQFMCPKCAPGPEAPVEPTMVPVHMAHQQKPWWRLW